MGRPTNRELAEKQANEPSAAVPDLTELNKLLTP